MPLEPSSQPESNASPWQQDILFVEGKVVATSHIRQIPGSHRPLEAEVLAEFHPVGEAAFK